MPVVDLDKKQLARYAGKKLDTEKLKEKMEMIGSSVERVQGDMISVEVFPNRPDLLSEEGFGRALAGVLETATGLPKYTIHKSDYKVSVDPGVKRVREHVVGAVVRGVTIDKAFLKALMQIQEKLHMTHSRNRKNAAAGIHDLDAIKFPLRYGTVREDFGFIPLESTSEMTIKQILERHPKGRAYAHLLEKDVYPVWLDAKNMVLSMPPIINSTHTAITTSTKNVFLDVTGLDKRVTEQVLNILVTMLADRGGRIYAVKVGAVTYPRLEPASMMLKPAYVNKVLGTQLKDSEIVRCLKKMRFGAEMSGGKIRVLIPPYRTDILHPIDLVEDIAIGYGYENFKPEIPRVSTIGEESREVILARKLSEIMVGLGYLECNTYHLSNKDILLTKMNLHDIELVRATNAVNINYDMLRNALLPGLVKILSENKHHEYPQRLFEISTVITPNEKGEHKSDERLMLSILTSHSTAEFTEIKSVCEALYRALGKSCKFRPATRPSYMKGRCASVIVDGKSVGIIGEIHPKVLNNFELGNAVAAMEVDVF